MKQQVTRDERCRGPFWVHSLRGTGIRFVSVYRLLASEAKYRQLVEHKHMYQMYTVLIIWAI